MANSDSQRSFEQGRIIYSYAHGVSEILGVGSVAEASELMYRIRPLYDSSKGPVSFTVNCCHTRELNSLEALNAAITELQKHGEISRISYKEIMDAFSSGELCQITRLLPDLYDHVRKGDGKNLRLTSRRFRRFGDRPYEKLDLYTRAYSISMYLVAGEITVQVDGVRQLAGLHDPSTIIFSQVRSVLIRMAAGELSGITFDSFVDKESLQRLAREPTVPDETVGPDDPTNLPKNGLRFPAP